MRRDLLYVSSIGEDCCEAAREFGLGIELAQFCTAARLDGAPPEPRGSFRWNAACLHQAGSCCTGRSTS